jgi:exodeoxyribonuclease-1
MSNKIQPTILWHDYETWGVNPQKDFPSQFAGIRTDHELNIIGKPLNWFCQIPNDYLPQPQAALVTGITPQQTLRDGLIESEFIAKIVEQMAQPNTCTAGYNSIRFDDEVTRFSLYRNLREPYAREWQNSNSRWDIIDLVRACYALRPDGINWVYKEDGSPSFKLDQLAPANDIEHVDAHDALADVYATIELAKKIKSAQPKLYEYIFNSRGKRVLAEMINIKEFVPLVHISSKLPATQGCCTWVLPIAYHPVNKNAVICINLALSPTPLFSLSPEELLNKLYQPNHMLEEGEQRLPIKLIHLNKCPVLAPAKTLTEENAERLGIDRQSCLDNLAMIKQQPQLSEKLINMYALQSHSSEPVDPDFALYTDGFINDRDRQLLQQVISSEPEQLGAHQWQFEDHRLATMLFRYRARNFPQTLNDQEMQRWQRHRHYRITDPDSPGSIKMPEYVMQLEQLATEHQHDPSKQAIIRALYQYAENL